MISSAEAPGVVDVSRKDAKLAKLISSAEAPGL